MIRSVLVVLVLVHVCLLLVHEILRTDCGRWYERRRWSHTTRKTGKHRHPLTTSTTCMVTTSTTSMVTTSTTSMVTMLVVVRLRPPLLVPKRRLRGRIVIRKRRFHIAPTRQMAIVLTVLRWRAVRNASDVIVLNHLAERLRSRRSIAT